MASLRKPACATDLPYPSCSHSSLALLPPRSWTEWWKNGSSLSGVEEVPSGRLVTHSAAFSFIALSLKAAFVDPGGFTKTGEDWRSPVGLPRFQQRLFGAFVSLLLDNELVAGAFLVALAFHAYLRTGEALGLCFSDLQVNGSTGVVTIRGGKSGLRNNMDEAIAIYDSGVLKLARLAKLLPHAQEPRSKVWNQSASAFRKMFQRCILHFELQKLELKPYSLRRGGATYDYMRQGILEPILLRGRWHSLQVARLYIEDGLAQLPSLQLPQMQQKRLATAARPFTSFFSWTPFWVCLGSWKEGTQL